MEDRSAKALAAAVNALMEYFDTVQIFVTKNKSDDETIGQTCGRGNLFGRIGQIGLWLSEVQSRLIDNNENET